jgi:DNA polymerase
VGAAGQLLNKMLAAAQTPRDAVYITNIVPWRPPGNRKPTTLETQICLPFIKRHIALAQPKALLLLGGTPTNALTGKPEGITRLRGRLQTIDIGGKALPTLPTFHPAYLLRQPGHKAFAWADMLALKEALARP